MDFFKNSELRTLVTVHNISDYYTFLQWMTGHKIAHTHALDSRSRSFFSLQWRYRHIKRIILALHIAYTYKLQPKHVETYLYVQFVRMTFYAEIYRDDRTARLSVCIYKGDWPLLAFVWVYAFRLRLHTSGCLMTKGKTLREAYCTYGIIRCTLNYNLLRYTSTNGGDLKRFGVIDILDLCNSWG